MAKKVKRDQQRRPGHTRVSSKMQITIPKAVAVAAGVLPGDELRVENTPDGRLVLSRAADPVEDLAGSFHYPPDYLKELRSEWD